MAKIDLQKVIEVGLGAFTVSKDKIQELIDELVDEGEVTQREAKSFANKILDRVKKERDEIKKTIQEEVQSVVTKLGIVSKSDFKALEKKVSSIEKKLKSKS